MTKLNSSHCSWTQYYNISVLKNVSRWNETLQKDVIKEEPGLETLGTPKTSLTINDCDVDDEVCPVPGLGYGPATPEEPGGVPNDIWNGMACTNQTFEWIPTKKNVTIPYWVNYMETDDGPGPPNPHLMQHNLTSSQGRNLTLMAELGIPTGFLRTWEWGDPKPGCIDRSDPCGYCNLNYTYCEPKGVQCIRSLNDGDYFPLRAITHEDIHNYKVDALTHDSYCCKYHKHCARNTLTIQVESCLGAVEMYVDIIPNPSKERYLWKSAWQHQSGYVQRLAFPVYHAVYYMSIYGAANPSGAERSKNLYDGLPGKSTYTLYSSTSTTVQTQKPGCGGYIKLEGSTALDKNIPNIVSLEISWCGLSDPLGRPVVYKVYSIVLPTADGLESYQKNLGSPCAMEMNGNLDVKMKSKTYGLAEANSRYRHSMVIDKDMYYLLNIYAVNDVGIGKAYTIFLNEPPKGDLAMLESAGAQIIVGSGLAAFIVMVGLLIYYGKIRPKMVQKAQQKVLEERALIEEQRQQATKTKKKSKNRKGAYIALPKGPGQA